jgi:hypothetical protein
MIRYICTSPSAAGRQSSAIIEQKATSGHRAGGNQQFFGFPHAEYSSKPEHPHVATGTFILDEVIPRS